MEMFKRLIASLVIFVPLGMYVFGLQVTYDGVEILKEPILKATIFLVALVAGSATYDFTKRVLLMPSRNFERFFDKFFSASAACIFILIFASTAFLILEYSELKNMIPPWAGYISYFSALGCIPWFVTDLTRAIEAATK